MILLAVFLLVFFGAPVAIGVWYGRAATRLMLTPPQQTKAKPDDPDAPR